MKVSSVAINVAHTNFNISFNSLVNVRVDTGSLIVERMQANAPQMLETASKLYDTDKSIRSAVDSTQENSNLAEARGLGTFNYRGVGTTANWLSYFGACLLLCRLEILVVVHQHILHN